MKRIILVSLVVAAVPAALHAQMPAPGAQAAIELATLQPQRTGVSYAQYLVDSMLARHHDLVELDIHATPPGSDRSVIIASKTPARVGKTSDFDDVAVFKSGEPRVEINPRGEQNAEVELLLFDIYQQPIGTVEMTFPYTPGSDRDVLVHVAAQYRDEIARRILDLGSLVEPAQLDPRLSTNTYAQYLVDDTLAANPGIEVIALHVGTPRTGPGYPIIASNIGRIGKPADESDLEVIKSGKPHSTVDAKGRRFESKVALKDASGATLGEVAIIFPYRLISNADTLQGLAERIAAGLAARIASAAQLDGPYPAVQPAELEAQAIEKYNLQELGNSQALPMTKEVVSGAALAQSAQDGYSEAIKTQAGIAATNSSGSTNDTVSIRGIKLNNFANYRIDGGVPIAGVITTPTENKERLETLKGANALMFGVASPAGIINLVTKRAGPRDVTSFGVAGNWFGQYGALLDVGRRFGPELQFGARINVSDTHLENGVHGTGGTGEFASIGLDWRVTQNLSLQGDFEYYAKHVPEQAGISLLPAVNGIVPITRVPDPRNNLVDGWNKFSAQTENYQVRADYNLSEDWRILVQGGQSLSHRNRYTVRIGGYNADTGANGSVTVQPLTNDFGNTFGRAELLGHFNTWDFTNDLTLGVSYTSRKSVSYNQNNTTLSQKQNIYDPIELAPPVFTKPFTANPTQDSKDGDIYIYDTVTVLPQLKLLAGVRWVKDEEVNGPKTSTSYVASPGFGILYDVLPTTTLFASYLEGLEAGGTSPANAANPNIILAPAVSKQKEIGVRDSYFKGLSLSVSYFDITRANAVTDPVTNIFGYNGDLSYKGVEGTLAYTFLRDWTLNAAVLWLDAVQNAPNQPLINGKVPESTAAWNGNVGLTYRAPWLPGLTLKAGVRAISNRPVNPQDQGYIPGYALYDAGVSYTTRIGGNRVALQLTADNLANRRYWNSVTTGTYGIGMDTNLRFTAKIDF
jgi:iron complex outermembrane receptor protein